MSRRPRDHTSQGEVVRAGLGRSAQLVNGGLRNLLR
jgi:hypothetical protein